MWINLPRPKPTPMAKGGRPMPCRLWLCLLLACPPAWADWHGKLSVLSEYVYRGYSKSWGNPVVQGQLDYQDASGWFAGAAVSQASFDGRDYPEHTDLEAKPFLGVHWPLGTDWRAELSAYGYIYDGDVFSKPADFVEFSAALHYQDWLSGKISVAPDAYQRQATVDYELNYRHDLTDTVQFSAGLGLYQADRLLGKNYLYWNLGASWFLDAHLVFDCRYVDVQLDGDYAAGSRPDAFHPKLLGSQLLLTLSVGF